MAEILAQDVVVTDHRYFLDRLVHDLREPLRSIQVFSELLKDEASGFLNAESQRFLDELLKGAARVRDLVDCVSEYTAALTPDTRDPNASVHLALRAATANLKDEIEASHAQIVISEPLPNVRVSIERLVQVFEALIENSIKFRGDKTPSVCISAYPETDDFWVIRVEDNGIGIDEGDIAHIFRPFSRLNGNDYTGAGLGLALCGIIVQTHGGRIWAESQPTAGTTIYFSVPAGDS